MSIQIGDQIPAAIMRILQDGAQKSIATDEYFSGRKVVLFSVPGAFTPTCSSKHLPGFVDHAQQFFDEGVDAIACMSVNDAFVMHAWGESANAEKIDMLADGNGEFSAALGLEQDSTVAGMGMRSRRFSMVAEDGVVTILFVEAPGEFRLSSAEHLLANL
jgi:peroxiredoxin